MILSQTVTIRHTTPGAAVAAATQVVPVPVREIPAVVAAVPTIPVMFQALTDGVVQLIAAAVM